MLVIKLSILFSLPFDLQSEDFLVDKRQLRRSLLRLKVSALWFLSGETKGLFNPLPHVSQNLQPGSPLQTLLFTLPLAVINRGKKHKETQFRIQNVGSKRPHKSKKSKHFCHVFKTWYCGKKAEVTSFKALFECFCIWQEFVTCSASQFLACGFVKQ